MRELVGSCYTNVTGAPLTERAQFQAEIEKLVASHALHGSESLCKLLRYLGRQALERPGTAVKEYQIATEVFGRQADFDPQLDSMVRVQAGRLRTKLAEYYNTEGATDRILVELPKGSYALALIGWLLWTQRESDVSAANAAGAISAPAPIRIFWKGFVRGPEEPWVIFSNAAFVGRPNTGMRYYDAAKDAKSPILDHYTGVGEVLAVHSLDIVFGELHQAVRVKRGSLFSLDDAKNNDLIFMGSPSENLTLLEIPSTSEFVFKKVTSGPQEGNVEIVNVHPAKGEADKYVLGPSNTSLAEDYALVALVKGISPEHWELILAGTTTIGTQAAVEYVTRENYLDELLKRMSVAQPSELKPFEAVIHVKVARGVPVESSLVALRVLN